MMTMLLAFAAGVAAAVLFPKLFALGKVAIEKAKELAE